MASKSANPKNKRNRAAFKSASRTRSEECIWEIEGRTRFVDIEILNFQGFYPKTFPL
jgi:hypothetical protein